ncbi:class I SAM-dependent methyltransferase [Pyxidicoccus parkwayensis]|uniref:Class I SAM-dependent methyltransferase n=1 Tax=Pyxidicoccus parkwayensis TaxID=2813578 RepID=A0ABX7NTE0_9BACT|nr:class I SAM-dependent methyltransferase [Pyxidicoccus parkwaysis]QSQ20785.1 class I SAM-dependent methyltransferase [Pyxidicoccus parkwaysis]
MTLHPSRALRETHAFVEPLLAGRRRVLDVGCGRGELAALLASAGHDVTAIDVKLPPERVVAPGVTWHETGFLGFEAAPFDAILFVTSLHHITPLADVVEHARRLLVTGGLLIAEEFSVEAPDAATARWYFETQELLAAADRYPASRIHGTPSTEPVSRWREEHAHDGEALTEGRRMKEELGRRFELLGAREGPYLYRYIAAGTAAHCGAETPVAEAIIAHIYEAEQRGIDAGALKPVGLRLWARRPA